MIFRKYKKEIIIEQYEAYRDCSELPLYNWIKLAVTSDYKWLVKSGKTNADLSNIYDTILAEYTALIKDVRSSQELQLKIAITTIASRIDHVTICVNQLRIKRDERLISILQNELGFYRLTYEDLAKDLELTETLMRSDIVKFEQKKIQYEKMFEGSAENANGEIDFYDQIRVIGKWIGYSIDPHNTSLMQYVTYLNALKMEIKNDQAKR